MGLGNLETFRDQLAIAHPGLGHALWEPRVPIGYPPAEIGDVGNMFMGHFHRIFNVLLPGDHPSQLFGVPENYEPLQLREQDHIDSETLPPSNFCSHGIFGVPPGGSGVFDSGSTSPSEVPFSCTRKRGAVLSLPTTSRREDTRLQVDFCKWIITHIDSWFAFTSNLGMGIDMEDFILVTGCHRTKTWFNVAFVGNEVKPKARLSRISRQAEIAGASDAWQELIQRTPGSSLSEGKELPVDQCVFIRGFRMKRIFFGAHPRARRAATHQPDSSESGYVVESIVDVPKYQDPMDVLLEYLANHAPHCDMVLVHDDDLDRILGATATNQTSLETFEPTAAMHYLKKLKPGIGVMSEDQLPTSYQSPRIAAQHLRVAMFSDLLESLVPSA